MNLGVLAFGDSITNGGGELQWGVALQSWALWLARSLGVPYSPYAADGARAIDVVEHQIPVFERSAAHPDGRYDVGCVYIGVNDVRAADWDPGAFETAFTAVLTWLSPRCDRLLAVSPPRELGRPSPVQAIARLRSIIETSAREHGALLVDLGDWGARNLVMVDRVHPTAFGQITIAERALQVLAADGLQARADPRTMLRFERTWWGRLRGDATYAYRQAKLSLRLLVP